MKYVVLILLSIIIFFSSAYSDDRWPISPPSNALEIIFGESLTVKTWREYGRVWVEIEAFNIYDMETGQVYIYSPYISNSKFILVQNSKDYSTGCLLTNRNTCFRDYLYEKKVFEINYYYYDSPHPVRSSSFDIKDSFDLYWVHNDVKEEYVTIPAAVVYNLSVELDPPEGGIIEKMYDIPNTDDYIEYSQPGRYEFDESIYLSVKPKTGYEFSHWDNDENMIQTSYRFIMPENDQAVVAHFKPIQTTSTDSGSSSGSERGGCFINSLR